MTRSLLLVPILMTTGCAHTQLARNVERQATTIADIQEQQVLDNIAMFCVNSGSTPFFATPTGGSTGLNRNATGTFGLSWNPTTLTGITAGGNGSQQTTRGWTLAPVNDPVKLGLMKAVYRRVTCTQCNHCDCNCHASDCKLRNFFSSDLNCHTPNGWFHVGDDAPCEDNCCVKVGEYCGKYVWVDQANFECLAQVTLAILDIATADAERLATAGGDPTKTVDIEQTFTGAAGETLKGKYTVSEEKYQDLIDGKNNTINKNAGESEVPNLFVPEVVAPKRTGGHLELHNRLSDQLNLIQGSQPISP